MCIGMIKIWFDHYGRGKEYGERESKSNFFRIFSQVFLLASLVWAKDRFEMGGG